MKEMLTNCYIYGGTSIKTTDKMKEMIEGTH